MPRGVNKCIFIGNLGADPESRYTTNGTAVTNIRLAVSEQWKDRNSGEQQERTEWVRVSAFGKLAEIMSQYLQKGSQVYIEGRMQTDKYQDDQGNDRYATKIVANDMQMLGGKGGGQQSGQGQAPAGGGEDEELDDLPF